MTRIRTITPISDQVAPKVAANTGLALYLPDGTRYQGVYYNVEGQYTTTPTLTPNTVVLSIRPPFKRDTAVYDSIKGDLTSLYVPPTEYIPNITTTDITIGYIQRYFLMKRNEPGKFVEISEIQYNKYSLSNQQAIDANVWKRFALRWSIAGPLNEVIAANRKTVAVYESEDNLPGLSKFLFKLDEFYLGKR
jgi:hypothetical protein